MKNNDLPRLDQIPEFREQLLPYCRLKLGEIWEDEQGKHKVACLDAANSNHISSLMDTNVAQLAVHDPPTTMLSLKNVVLKSIFPGVSNG